MTPYLNILVAIYNVLINTLSQLLKPYIQIKINGQS